MFLELNGGWRRRIGLHLPQRRKDRASSIKGGYLQRHSDLLTILTVVAIMVVVGSGIYYPGESIHATMQAPGSSPGRLPRSSCYLGTTTGHSVWRCQAYAVACGGVGPRSAARAVHDHQQLVPDVPDRSA
jgi:hypothetical protein